MSYQEKRNIVSMVSSALLLAAYGAFAIGKYLSGTLGPEDTKAWALAILIFLGAGIGSMVAIQILFHMLLSVAIAIKEKDKGDRAIEKTIEATVVEDEMDKLIAMKSSRIGFACAGMGFVASLVAAVMGCGVALMLNILFLSFVLGSIIESAINLYFYRKGLSHG